MNLNTNFLLHKALEAISNQSFESANIYINQALKAAPKSSEVNRIAGVISVFLRKNEKALNFFNRAIELNSINSNALSNKSNLLSELGQHDEAIHLIEKAIQLDKKNFEFPNNLGNIFQKLGQYDKAINSYQKAIDLNPFYADAYNNLGNTYKKILKKDNAIAYFEKTLQINPYHYDAQLTLGCLLLENFNFKEGWKYYESRIFLHDKFISKKPAWNGIEKETRLLIVGEQGIGDQILHASLILNFDKSKQKIIVAVDKRLIPVFSRSFPNYTFIDLKSNIDENAYDEFIMLGSLGKYFRKNIDDFHSNKAYLFADESLKIVNKNQRKNSLVCGLSWNSTNIKVGNKKSFSLISLDPIFEIKNLDFTSLQHGDTLSEISEIESKHNISFNDSADIDLFNDINSLVNLIDSCSFVITGSNSIAHLSGALGKKTFLLLPYSDGMFWYWHSIDNQSIWYPTVKIFRQQKDGDWTSPVLELKKFIEENYFAN